MPESTPAEPETKEPGHILHVKNALGWLNAARDELIDAMATTKGLDRSAIIGLLSDALSLITDSIEPVRAVLGYPPEFVEDDEENEDDE